MKKITQLIFIFFIFSFSLSAQVAYYDAITLKDDLVYDEVQKRWQWAHGSSHEILRQYLKDVSSIQDMRKEIANNPFLKDYYLNASSGEDSEAYLKEVKEFIPSIAGKLGGLDVTNFAQGLSKFMIERAKAELNAAFFAKFKKFTKDADVALLFPVTTNRLSYLLSYQYTEMIDQLRNAFYEDLNNLPDNTLVLLEEGSSFYALWTNNPEFTIAVNSLKLIRQLDYLSPPDFIAQLQTVTKDAINAANGDMVKIQKIENFGSSLQLAAIFSESVRASSGTRNWVSSADFYEHIVKDPVTRRIFNGLVYQLIKKESISFNKVFLSDEINNKKAELEWFMNRVDEFVFLANKVDHSLGEIKKYRKEGQTIKDDQIYSYINTTLQIGEFGSQFIAKYYNSPNSPKIDDYLKITASANDIYRYVYQNQYSSAIIAVADLFKAFDPEKGEKFTSRFVKYGTFMANMVEAETPDDVAKVIEAAALPVGSSSIKKRSEWNLALNGYFGAFHRTNTSGFTATNAWNSEWAVSVPIGLSLSKGLNKWGSVSLMGVLLDVGAIVDYQLTTGDDEKIESEITLGNIFSPGGYLIYGLPPNVPISVGFGYQYGPGLSEISATDNTTVINTPNGRWGFLIAVDIPMFNIWNVGK